MVSQAEIYFLLTVRGLDLEWKHDSLQKTAADLDMMGHKPHILHPGLWTPADTSSGCVIFKGCALHTILEKCQPSLAASMHLTFHITANVPETDLDTNKASGLSDMG